MTLHNKISSIASKSLAVFLAISMSFLGVPFVPAVAAESSVDEVTVENAAVKQSAADLLSQAREDFLASQTVLGYAPRDVSLLWSAGALRIDSSGYYRLEADVTAESSLQVELAKGQVAVLDLNGHCVVASEEAQSVISFTSHGGTLLVVDSNVWVQEADQVAKADENEDAAIADWKDPQASLTLTLANRTDACQVISAKYEEVQAENSTEIAAEEFDEKAQGVDGAANLICENVIVATQAAASLSDDEQVDCVTGIASDKAIVYLAGDFASHLRAAKVAVDLSASQANLYRVADSFNSCQQLKVSQTDASEGDVFACVGDGFSMNGKMYSFEAEGAGIFVYQEDKRAFCLCCETEVTNGASDNRAIGALSAEDDGAEGVDLAAAWKAQTGGLEKSFTISEGGSYYLSEDIATSATLTINAAGADVILDFAGHTLTSENLSATLGAVYAKKASSVTLKNGTIDFQGLSSAGMFAVKSDVDCLNMSAMSAKIHPDGYSTSISNLLSSAIYASKGTVNASQCTVDIDLTNQANTSINGNGAPKSGPRGFYLESGVTSAVFDECTVKVRNSNVVKSQDLTDFDAKGYAFGLYSNTTGQVTVSGCAFDAGSALGAAVGVCGANIHMIGDRTDITASGAQQSTGFYALKESGITLDASVSVSLYNRSKSQVCLRSMAENGFVFGEGFSGEGLTAEIGKTDGRANEQNMRIGTFASTVTADRQAIIANSVTNAFTDAACFVTYDAQGLYFRMSVDKAPAEVIHEGVATQYSTFGAAFEAAVVGDTVRALGDLGDIVFSGSGNEEDCYIIDLNGFTAHSFLCSSNANVTLKNGSIDGYNANNYAAVGYTGKGCLTVVDVAIRNTSNIAQNCYGVLLSSTGKCYLTNVNMTILGARSGAYGVCQTLSKGGDCTITGGTISVEALSSSMNSYGMCFSATDNQVSLSGCSIRVTGLGNALRGVEVRAGLSMRGTVGETTISVTNTGSASEAYGVVARSKDAEVDLTDVSIAMNSTQSIDGAQYWCISAGVTNGLSASQWSLAGTTSLYSSTTTDMRIYGAAAVLASNFSNADSDPIAVDSEAVTDRVFATIEDTSVDLSAQFTSVTSSSYDGWSAQQEESNLKWTRDPVAYSSTGQSYELLQDAFDQSDQGGTITLARDCTESGNLSIDKSLTLDLCGHTLALAADTGGAAGSDGTGGALRVTSGDVAIRDSSVDKGCFDIAVGASIETEKSSSNGYKGVCVNGGANLSIDAAVVKISYTGATSLQPQFTLKGISVLDGNVSLSNSSNIIVRSCLDEGYGASAVYGLYAEKACSGSILVDESSSVEVTNSSQLDDQGRVTWPDSSGSSSTGAGANGGGDTKNLMKFDVEEGSELYSLIQKEFRINASYDSAVESSDPEHGLNIYYVTALTLSNGLTIWAYSDPVDPSEAGSVDSVVAKYIFIRHDYDIAMDAYGVGSDVDFSGEVNVAGSLRAYTSMGHVYGAYEGGGEWTVDESNLQVAASKESYYSLAKTKFDLSEYISFPGGEKDIVYPDGSSYKKVSELFSTERNVAKVGTDYDVVKADSTSRYAGDPAEQAATTVDVTFTNIHDTAGGMQDDITNQVPYGQTLASTGASKVQPSDYTDIVTDVMYRFVGWKVSGSSLSYYVYDPEDLYQSLLIDKQFQAEQGPVTCTACYVPVGRDQHLVAFKVEYAIIAYAVDNGSSGSFAESYNSGDLSAPSRLTSTSGYSYIFRGWSEGRSDNSLVEEGVDLYTGLLPDSSTDVVYTARFYEQQSLPDVVFYTKVKSVDGAYVWNASTLKRVDWKGDYSSRVNAIAQIGVTAFVDNGVIYTMKGWSTRVSDLTPIYTDVPPLNPDTNDFNGHDTFYAVYDAQEIKLKANFYSEGNLYATASDLAYDASISDAWSKACNMKKPTYSTGEFLFRGWAQSSDASTYLETGSTKLSSLLPETGNTEVNLYALWNEAFPTVVFYDSDKTTVIDVVEVEYGGSVEDSLGETVLPKGANKDLFEGWVDSSGAAWSTKTKVYKSLSVYATYTKTSGGSGSLDPNEDPTDSSGSSSNSSDGSSSASQSSSATSSALGSSSLSAASLSGATLSATAASTKVSSAEGGESSGASAFDALSAENNKSAQTEEGENGPNNTAGTIMFYAVFALAIAGAAIAVRWFLKRRVTDEAVEDDLFAKLDSAESIHF